LPQLLIIVLIQGDLRHFNWGRHMNAAKFYEDAQECLRLADRATAQEDKALWADLARAWLLLGEQVEHVNQSSTGELPKSSTQASLDRQ
jgi:hypothetical protein